MRLSDLTRNFRVEPVPAPDAASVEARRLHDRMHAGNYLRRESGKGEFLALAAVQQIRAIGVTVDEDQRRSCLRNDKGCTEEEVTALLQRDNHEEDARYLGADGRNFGQRTRDTYHLADVFIPLDDEDSLKRFLRLVFGNPFETPTADEYAMFMAFSASLRSADLSRQVGAAIVGDGQR